MESFDIYAYFNSRDVATHCKRIGHRFSASETAYLVWQSNHHTLEQKILAWEKIIETMPDEEQEIFAYTDGHGLHHFLKKYINRLQQFLTEFQTDGSDWVYSFETLYGNAPDRFLDESPLFTSYQACHQAMLAVGKQALAFRVTKKPLCHRPEHRQPESMVYLNEKAEPMSVSVESCCDEYAILIPACGFYEMFLDIPTPFRRGDIVTGLGLYGNRTGPMVVDQLAEKQGLDYLDMSARLWELDRQGRLVCNEDVSYLSLEYYHGPLTGQDRFLYALHNHIQNALPMEDLLRSYAITVLERMAESRVDFYGWAEGTLQLSGLESDSISIP